MRASGRADDVLRPVSIEPVLAGQAEAPRPVRAGGTGMLCAATVEPRVPGLPINAAGEDRMVRRGEAGGAGAGAPGVDGTGFCGETPESLGTARRLRRGDRLVLATHNAGKLREIAALLAPHGIAVISAGALGLPEPEEDAPDFAGNARLKALAAASASGGPALADDSGFCLAALGGDPGVLSARWAGPGKDFAAAMALVQARLGEAPDRRAWFTCVLCLAWPDGWSATFLGRVEGEACWPPRGALGFGYDPMFVPVGATLSYGEMAPALKHAGSHRARAFAQLAAACLP